MQLDRIDTHTVSWIRYKATDEKYTTALNPDTFKAA